MRESGNDGLKVGRVSWQPTHRYGTRDDKIDHIDVRPHKTFMIFARAHYEFDHQTA